MELEWYELNNERIGKWVHSKDSDRLKKLRFDLESIQFIESYLLENYTKEKFDSTSDKSELDAIAAFVGEVIYVLLPDCKWLIDKEDKSNVYFNLPVVQTRYSGQVSVHMLVKEVIYKRTGSVLATRIQKITDYDNKMAAAIAQNSNQ